MQRADQNNGEAWKLQLNALENVDGIAAVDKPAAWERLQQKRGRQHSKVIGGWYRWAAACVLLALITAGIFNAVKQQQPVTATIQPVLEADKKLLVNTSPAATIIVQRKNEMQPAPVVNKLPIEKIKGPANNTVSIKEMINKIIEPADTVRQEMLSVILPTDTGSTLQASTQPAKKQLKIVHINSLDEPLLYTKQSGRTTGDSYTKKPVSSTPGKVSLLTGNSLFSIQLKPFKSN